MDRLDRDLYSIEEHDGKKYIHILGYAYDADDGTETPYRLVEFTWNYIPVGLSSDKFEKTYDLHLSECKQYVGDYDEAGIIDVLDNYFSETPKELAYEDINADTPCGYYIQS